MLRQDKTLQDGIDKKRLQAGWKEAIRERILGLSEGLRNAIALVAHVSFPKAFAVSSMEYGGKTFHFLSDQTRREFEKGPAAFAS